MFETYKVFEPFVMYRHRSSLDLDMLVVSVIDQTHAAILKVRYFNRFYGFFQPDPSSLPDEVVIERRHFENWKVVS